MKKFKKSLCKKFMNRAIANLLIVTLVVGLTPDSVFAESKKATDINDLEKVSSVEESQPTVLGEITSERGEKEKHFLLSNHNILAMEYSEPVHYYEDGEWKEIDNSLSLENAQEDDDFKGYTNRQTDFNAKLAETTAEDKLVKIEKDKYKLAFDLAEEETTTSSNAKSTIEDKIIKSEVKEKEDVNLKEMCETNGVTYDEVFETNTTSDYVVYSNVLADTDLEYQVTSTGIKENIIVNAKQESYDYTFDLEVENLTLQLKDNEIQAMDSKTKEVIYVIPTPYMYDSNDNVSMDVSYELKKTDDGYQLGVTADQEWMNSEDTVFPVTIDPIISTETTKAAIDSTFISKYTNTTNYYEYMMLLAGKDLSKYGICRTLVKFDLPSLNAGDIVVSAHLNLQQYDVESYTTYNPDLPLEAHMVTSEWEESTVTWDTMPNFNEEEALDYTYISRGDMDQVVTKTFNITKAAKAWYDDDVDNNGIIIKAEQETGNYDEVGMYGRFYSDKYNSDTDSYPVVMLEYRNTKGVESYYSYSEVEVGSTGTAHVNDYTGSLCFTENGVSTTGEILPASVYLVYNTNALEESDARSYPSCGAGWKLNIQQYVVNSSEFGLTGDAQTEYPYVYVDGTEHYFKKVVGEDNTVTYQDEDGLGLTLSFDAKTQFIIKDSSDNVYTFGANGTLKSIADKNGNTQTINYANDGKLIQSVTDGSGRTITINSENKVLTGIKDPAGRVTSYTVGDTMTKITKPDGSASTFTYDSDNAMTCVKDSSDYQLSFTYLSEAKGKRVAKLVEASQDSSGNSVAG